MSRGNAAVSVIARGLYGTHLLDHLAADGAGLARGQVAVVAVLQIHAHFGSGLHLELLHGLLGLRNVDLIVVAAHFSSLLTFEFLERMLISW